MIILGIETSCDDTAVALLEVKNGNFSVLKEVSGSQIDLHKQYGGVVPEVAARAHSDLIMPLVEEVLGGEKPDIIAVTSGPGLITALLVGVQTAAALSYAWDVPLVAVNHIEGHIYSNWLNYSNTSTHHPISAPKFPALCLIVSGGHTELILMRDHGKYELIGRTRDDAAGEAFDKIAKLIGFDYPGGPKISKAAEDGDPNAIKFPRPMIKSDNYDFSFAGLKTAALYWLRDNANTAGKATFPGQPREHGKITNYRLPITDLKNLSASFEQAIVDTLVTKTLRAVKKYKPKTVLLGGGVSANKKLRETISQKITTNYPKIMLTAPPLSATVDNAAMIAIAGYFASQKDSFTPWNKIKTDPNWRIENC